jgi:hypothetical protein
MDIGSIFLILALAILVGMYVTRPLAWQKTASQRSASAIPSEDHALSTLLAERDRAVTALQELDFDYILGKVPEEDYPAQRTALLQRGAGILLQLDQAQKSQINLQAEERLESMLTERRKAQVASENLGKNGNSRPPDDPLETLIATRRRSRQEKAVGFCHKCGGPLQKSDRFCPKCGSAVD